jgi:hypothetical protein
MNRANWQREEPEVQRKTAAFNRWHEPDDAKVSSPDVCPAKAGMFSRRQTCRGRSQSPVVWIAEAMETKTFEAYRQDLPRGGYESPGRNNSKRIVASKVIIPEGRAFIRRAKAT